MTARIAYLTALTSATPPGGGGRGTLRPRRRLFGGFPDPDADFREEPPNWGDPADTGTGARVPLAHTGQPLTEPPGLPRIQSPGPPGIESSGLPLPAETSLSAAAAHDPGHGGPIADPGPWASPAAGPPEPPDRASAAAVGQFAAHGARGQAASAGGTFAPAAEGPAATAPERADGVASVQTAGQSVPGARARTPRPAPSALPASSPQTAAAVRSLDSGQPSGYPQLPAVSGPPDDLTFPSPAVSAGTVPGGAGSAPAPQARPPRPHAGRYGIDPRRAAPHVFSPLEGAPAPVPVSVGPSAGLTAATAREHTNQPRPVRTESTVTAPAVVPGRQEQPGSTAAPAPAPSSALSIGTIEVTLVGPAPDPPSASTAHGETRQPPRRLSRGLGPRFGQAQT
jgi:hypothetical protein